MNNFSPNMLKTYQTCPKKYYFKYIEKINVPVSFSIFEKGKKIHAIANYFLQNINISRIETALTKEEILVWNTLLNNEYFQKDYFKSEYQLSCKIDKYWVGGRLDAIVKDNDQYYILDYKTGSIPKNPEYDYQTMIYLLCLDLLFKEKEKISFVYIDLKNKNNYVINYNDKLKSEYKQKISSICNTISSDSYYQCNENSCKYCEYNKLCQTS